MLEFVGIGDMHYDKLNTLFSNADELISKELTKPLRYAVDNGIKYAFIYGDIGEKARISYEGNLAFWETLFLEEFKSLEYHIILGNHDFDEHGRHSLELLVWVAKRLGRRLFIYTQATVVKLDGVKVNFLPYPFKKTLSDCVNIGHFEVAGSTRDNGRQIKDGFSTKHFCCIGHLHTPHTVNSCYYSGTLFQTNFGESLPKKFHHVRVKSDMTHRVKLVPNDPDFKLFNLEVYSIKDLKQVDTNPLYLYKAFIQEGVDIDPDLFAKYPNIVKLVWFKTKTELTTLLEEEWKSMESVDNLYQPEEDLKVFMKEKRANPDLRKRVIRLNRKLLQSLSR